MTFGSRRFLLVLPLIAVLALVACSGSKNNSSSSSTSPVSTVASTPDTTGTEARSAASPSPNSPDCKYSAKLFEAFAPFLVGVFGLLDVGLSATPGPSSETALTPDQAKKVMDSLVTASTQSITALGKVSPPNDFKQYHADLRGQFVTLNQQLKDAQKAAASGDTQKVQDLLAGGNAFDDPTNGLDKKYPELSARLSGCPSPLNGN